jgi:hypothetical protein
MNWKKACESLQKYSKIREVYTIPREYNKIYSFPKNFVGIVYVQTFFKTSPQPSPYRRGSIKEKIIKSLLFPLSCKERGLGGEVFR